MKQPPMADLVPSFDPPEQWRTPDQKAELKEPEWAELRDRIKARDGHTCRFCGHRNDYWMTVDHIDGDSTNNSDSNLQTLCYWCHMVKHSGLWCVVNSVTDLYEKPAHLSQVDVIKQTRELRGQGLADEVILARLGLTQKVPFKQNHAYLATKVAFITMRSFVRDDGRTMFPGRVGVRVGGRYLRAIEEPPPSGWITQPRPESQPSR